MSGKASPEFKVAMARYEYAKAHGFDPSLVSDLWDAVMRTLHGTPEPPVWAKIKNCAKAWQEKYGDFWATGGDCPDLKWNPPLIDRVDPSPLDDDFDRLMREW